MSQHNMFLPTNRPTDLQKNLIYFIYLYKKINAMKKILLLLVGLLLISCDPENVPEPKGKLDPNAMIVIKPAKGVQLRSTVSGLTALEVVEQATGIKWQSHWFDNRYYDDAKNIGRGFRPDQRDFDIPALKMLGIDIIAFDYDIDNTLYHYFFKDFIYGFNVVITDVNSDTIAYVPNEVINTARPLIESAYENEDYDEVYRLFNEAFTFLPIE